jgi:hypothetical protein
MRHPMYKNPALYILGALIAITACSTSHKKSKNAITYSMEKINLLPKETVESSGIIFFDSLVWTFNDGGHDPVLFGLDIHSCNIIKEIELTEAKNIDWEDITQDASSVYIGDIGNNWGNRKDLCIYKISKSALYHHKKKKEIKVHKIKFYYPDQTRFTYKFEDTPFDCEALVCAGDSLLLFTKDWKSHKSVIYSVPVYPGEYAARKLAVFNSDGLITGADFDPESEKLALCGHKNHVPFVIITNVNNLIDSQDREEVRFDLKDLNGIQIEGIAFYGNSIYLSSETNSKAESALFKLN